MFPFPIKPTLLNLFLLCISFHASHSVSPLFHFCFSHENYTSNSPYATNLNQLFSLLYTKVPPSGFGLASVGKGVADRANGLALCRGDVATTNCESCVVEASKKLQERCPDKKGAIVWYDYCLLKYSNEYFFGEIDTKNKFYMINIYDVDDPTSFNSKVNELLSSLSHEASGTPELYAIGELKLEGSRTLYGLAQCTRDLLGPGCKKCLDDAISEIPNCCDGKKGGRVVGGSCYVRYELYPIVEA
ncbi:cysteine-rich repeat secretory protein 38-like [Senna tora]|uniref:Cysteine-rich repeat secretory protein 38-like n=1 Tax=Senna tora TaxID=362788 RepID=A0A834TJ15_9FABA|nr:cysteine-rich repeat secretory protein 38-like [Senna tora]